MSRACRPQASAFSLRGGRPRNEDAFLVLDEGHEIVRKRGEGWLFAVADGLGGHAGGEVASRMAVDTLVEYFDTVRGRGGNDPLERLEGLFRLADERIRLRGGRESALFGMGTTLTALLLRGTSGYFTHVGDSRLYVIRDGRVRVLTEDQDVANRLLRAGDLDEEGFRKSPFRGSLLSYLGKGRIVVEKGAFDLRRGDRCLLATDGFTAVVSEAEIAEAAGAAGDVPAFVDALRDRTSARAPADNATVVVVGCDEIVESDVGPLDTTP